MKDQIKVLVWFKKNANPKYACYCSKVTEEQVIDAVVKHGSKTVQQVNAITGAMKNSNCKENNPMGVCCHKIIQEAINKGLAMK
ncbi:BFD-like (2Fe-2S) protein [Desulforamulus profundi]|uniref:BFD-like (2Fe-2S) protein n=1 Tax=Desulforamulus profundi TaxID=1383067 RepID=A0A2C6MDP4_9FIRM|nr:BFD-like (2Fe-2S) protein [Desulforamulus profundi]